MAVRAVNALPVAQRRADGKVSKQIGTLAWGRSLANQKPIVGSTCAYAVAITPTARPSRPNPAAWAAGSAVADV